MTLPPPVPPLVVCPKSDAAQMYVIPDQTSGGGVYFGVAQKLSRHQGYIREKPEYNLFFHESGFLHEQAFEFYSVPWKWVFSREQLLVVTRPSHETRTVQKWINLLERTGLFLGKPGFSQGLLFPSRLCSVEVKQILSDIAAFAAVTELSNLFNYKRQKNVGNPSACK